MGTVVTIAEAARRTMKLWESQDQQEARLDLKLAVKLKDARHKDYAELLDHVYGLLGEADTVLCICQDLGVDI